MASEKTQDQLWNEYEKAGREIDLLYLRLKAIENQMQNHIDPFSGEFDIAAKRWTELRDQIKQRGIERTELQRQFCEADRIMLARER